MGEDLYEQKFNILFVIFMSTMSTPFFPTFSKNVYTKKHIMAALFLEKTVGRSLTPGEHPHEISYSYCSASTSTSSLGSTQSDESL